MKIKFNSKKGEVTVAIHLVNFRQMAVEQQGLLQNIITKGEDITLKELSEKYPWAMGVLAAANAMIPLINEDPKCNYELNT